MLHAIVHVVVAIPDVGGQQASGIVATISLEDLDEVVGPMAVGTEFVTVVEGAT